LGGASVGVVVWVQETTSAAEVEVTVGVEIVNGGVTGSAVEVNVGATVDLESVLVTASAVEMDMGAIVNLESVPATASDVGGDVAVTDGALVTVSGGMDGDVDCHAGVEGQHTGCGSDYALRCWMKVLWYSIHFECACGVAVIVQELSQLPAKVGSDIALPNSTETWLCLFPLSTIIVEYSADISLGFDYALVSPLY
jgi:hypothetical protein